MKYKLFKLTALSILGIGLYVNGGPVVYALDYDESSKSIESAVNNNSAEESSESSIAESNSSLEEVNGQSGSIDSSDSVISSFSQQAKEQGKSDETFDDSQNDDQVAVGDTEEFSMPTNRSDLYTALQSFLALPGVSVLEKNTPRKSFIDISSHNGNLTVEDFRKIKSYGITGVIVKLTEATSYVNPYAKSQIENATVAGLKVSAYHYSWFENTAEAVAEANYFADQVKKMGLSSNTILINDIEEPKLSTKADHTANSLAFANQLNKLGYLNVKHYIGYYWLSSGMINENKLGQKNIWVAAYPYTLSTEEKYTQYSAWQWSGQLTIPGINCIFDISVDYSGEYSTNESALNKFKPMYCLYNPTNYEHFFTTSVAERDNLVKIGWYAK